MLVAVQPDFGSAMIIFLVAAAVIFTSGMNFKNIFRLGLFGVILAAPFILLLKDKIFAPYRLGRVEAFRILGSEFGYQLSNSILPLVQAD